MRWKTLSRVGLLAAALLLLSPTSRAVSAASPPTATWLDAVLRFADSALGTVHRVFGSNEELTEDETAPKQPDPAKNEPRSGQQSDAGSPQPTTEGGPEVDPNG